MTLRRPRVLIKSNAGAPSGAKIHNGGTWTAARMHTFIVNALRSASMRWAPKNECIKLARVRRGVYLCACCKEEVKPTMKVEGKTKKNIHVDHIEPVVPLTGFTNLDDYAKRLFCEVDNLQLLCHPCHDLKTKEETVQRAAHRRAGK